MEKKLTLGWIRERGENQRIAKSEEHYTGKNGAKHPSLWDVRNRKVVHNNPLED